MSEDVLSRLCALKCARSFSTCWLSMVLTLCLDTVAASPSAIEHRRALFPLCVQFFGHIHDSCNITDNKLSQRCQRNMAREFTRVFLAAVVETSCLPFSRASSAFRLTDLPEELALPRKGNQVSTFEGWGYLPRHYPHSICLNYSSQVLRGSSLGKSK